MHFLVHDDGGVTYPSLFHIVQNKNVSVAMAFATVPLNIRFRRNLTGANWTRWLHFVQRLMMVDLMNEPDRFVLSLTSSGVFSVKSMYADFMEGQTVFSSKIHLEVKSPIQSQDFYVVPRSPSHFN